MITIYDIEQGSPEWHKLHDGLWTGSTAHLLLANKPLPQWSTFAGNKYTNRGKLLEPIAIREYERETGEKVRKAGFVTNPQYPNAGFSPDGLSSRVLLEVKCFNGKKHEALVDGNIPTETLSQIHFGLVICELPKAVLLAFNPEYNPQLTIIEIPKDEVIAKNIRDKLNKNTRQRVEINV